ncbi:uncharacterized protein KD926_008165 [Aspergillus affinis]|uniref:uncharacterized protein n=1 Tax=Aspergillus affinis TaxID=1070780 RepID=UPI0022FEDD06|nr:uncharacterized protein KD926_008165 [Aspergillus affinis]KAI9040598.1 hypothetical protein KD926_008165 [Aspergillus affinis]
MKQTALTKKFFDRRDSLVTDGVEFLDDQSPFEVILHIDIPCFIIEKDYGDVCLAIGDGIAHRLAMYNFRNAGCLPLRDKVRMQLKYELNDLPDHEDTHTAKKLHERICEHLRSRAHIKVPFHRYVEENKWQTLYESLIIEEWTQP